MTSAVVLGGGLGGLLAASALTRHVDTVTIVESDQYPDSPATRKGLPQGHHNHMLMGGGAAALDSLLPGTIDRLYAAGAKRRGLTSGIMTLTAEGWYRRRPSDAHVVAASRPLIDHVVREQALALGNIDVLESTKVVGLVGDSSAVTGVRVEGADGERTLSADLVVDATGRRSKAPDWLAELGVAKVDEDTVDAGFAYSTRLYQAPESAGDDFPGVLVQPRAGTTEPGRGAALMPNEDGRWIVVMIGSRGGHPPTDEAGWWECARNTGHPIITELLASATPIGEIRAYRGMANRRRHFDKLPVPDGFVVLGDAATALNPVYAHGMSVAAFGAVSLRDELDSTGLTPGFAARAQKGIAKAGDFAWGTALATDHWLPGVESTITKRGSAFGQRFTARFTKVAAENDALADRMFRVASMAAPPSQMMTFSGMLSVLRGPKKTPLTAEDAIALFPEFSRVRVPSDSTVESDNAQS